MTTQDRERPQHPHIGPAICAELDDDLRVKFMDAIVTARTVIMHSGDYAAILKQTVQLVHSWVQTPASDSIRQQVTDARYDLNRLSLTYGSTQTSAVVCVGELLMAVTAVGNRDDQDVIAYLDSVTEWAGITKQRAQSQEKTVNG